MISKKNEKSNEVTVNVEVKVTRVKDFGNGSISFDCEANGIKIYGCTYKEGTSKKTGEEYQLVSFPQRKGKDGNYYNHVYFPTTPELIENITNQISYLL